MPKSKHRKKHKKAKIKRSEEQRKKIGQMGNMQRNLIKSMPVIAALDELK